MKTATKVLLIIGGILAILSALSFLACGIVLVVFSGPQFYDMILKMIQDGTAHSSLPGTPEQQVATIQSAFLIAGIVLLVEVLFLAIQAVIAFMASSRRSNTLYIANIVIGVITLSVFNLAGGIVGLVQDK